MLGLLVRDVTFVKSATNPVECFGADARFLVVFLDSGATLALGIALVLEGTLRVRNAERQQSCCDKHHNSM